MERKDSTVPANATLSSALTHAYLLRLIFQYLKYVDKVEPIQLRNIKRKGLSDIALTCKAFLEPALDTLWESLDSLLPLLKLLPSFTLVNEQYTLTGLPLENDWARFDAYACRVRTLSYGTSPLPLGGYLYTRLLQLHPKPFLPALRHIDFSSIEDSSHDLAGLFTLISPSLSSINLNRIMAHDLGVIESFICSLVTATVPLKEIVYQGCTSMNIMMNIVHFKNLKSFSVAIPNSELSSNFFSMLDTLENLTELDLDVRRCSLNMVPDDNIIQGRQNTRSFSPCLKNLRILCLTGTPTTLVVILTDIAAIHLESVSIWLCHRPEVDECPIMLVRCLKYLSISDSLQNFTLSHLSINQSCSLKLGTVLPFLRLQELRSLKIHHEQFLAEEDDMKLLAKSSPNLRVLELEAQKVTFASLRLFSEFCQSLQQLTLTLENIPPQVLAANFRSDHRLESLRILGNAHGFDAIDTSRYLDSLFPYLKTFQNNDPNKNWEQTGRLIKVYQDVRGCRISA